MLKRLFDLVAAAVGVVVLGPILGVIAVLVAWDSPGPVLFRQVRVGRYGRTFRICKFRTMRTEVSGTTRELTVRDDERITRVGAVLRRYKLDELPQLLNVVVGDMSLVGPRPEVPRYVERWDAETRAIVLSVRPGITDLASIRYRNESALLEESADPERKYIEEIAPAKNRLARQYVEHRTLWMDLRIIAQTLLAIVR